MIDLTMASKILIYVIISNLFAKFVSCEPCETQLSWDSFGCCFYETDLPTYANCSYNDGQCEAVDSWGTDEDLCDKFNWNTQSQNPYRIVCKGQKEYSNNETRFKWECPKPDPDPKTAEVILKPVPGNLEKDSKSFFLSIKLTNSFPEPSSTIQFEDNNAWSYCKDYSKLTELSGLFTVSCNYKIILGNRDTKFKVVVTQKGFANQTFEYSVISKAFENGGPNTNGNVAGVLISLCFILVKNGFF